MAGERTSKIAWGARAPVRRKAQGPRSDHPTWGGKRPGAGRPKGAHDRKPRKPGIAFQNELRDYGLPADAPPEVKRIVNLAVDRVTDVICERVPAALSPSVLKGSAMVIEMLCRASSGEGSLVAALAQVDDRIKKSRALLTPAAPPAPDASVPDAIDAAWEPVPTTTPVDPPPSTPQERVAARYRATREAQERRTPPLTREELVRMQEESLEQLTRHRCIVEEKDR